jgi:hypothetical protein
MPLQPTFILGLFLRGVFGFSHLIIAFFIKTKTGRVFLDCFAKIGTISRTTSDSTDKSNGQNLLDIAVTNALELLRGQNFEN